MTIRLDDVETPGFYVVWTPERSADEVVVAGPYPNDLMAQFVRWQLDGWADGEFINYFLPLGAAQPEVW